MYEARTEKTLIEVLIESGRIKARKKNRYKAGKKR